MNPVYPGWKEDAERVIGEKGFKGFELCPQYHRYKINDDTGRRALDLAERLGVPVRVSGWFESIHQRSHIDITTEPEPDELIDAVRSFPAVK